MANKELIKMKEKIKEQINLINQDIESYKIKLIELEDMKEDLLEVEKKLR